MRAPPPIERDEKRMTDAAAIVLAALKLEADKAGAPLDSAFCAQVLNAVAGEALGSGAAPAPLHFCAPRRRTTMIDLTGQRFGRLQVTSLAAQRPKSGLRWQCVCDCGTVQEVAGGALRGGLTLSCGCLAREKNRALRMTHGHSAHGSVSSTYTVWSGMRNRCNNPRNRKYPDYGGRGIKVCERWARFDNFLADMGERPKGKSLERANVHGDYEPANCTWATPTEQSRNRRNVRRVTFNGKTQSVPDWADEIGIDRETLRRRFKAGWSAERALSSRLWGRA